MRKTTPPPFKKRKKKVIYNLSNIFSKKLGYKKLNQPVPRPDFRSYIRVLRAALCKIVEERLVGMPTYVNQTDAVFGPKGLIRGFSAGICVSRKSGICSN